MTQCIKKPELLSPARDTESLEAAIRFGADAVYLGGAEFGMRASARFDDIELEAALAFCHKNGVKAYVTCNTIPTGEELERLPDFIEHAAVCGADAFIVTDLGVLSLVRKIAPETDIHISTQLGVMNHLCANTLFEMGAKRIVAARELSLKDIRFLAENTPEELEIECFVHGAMCVSFSGRCLVSNYLTGRSSNKGDCAQPCRWKYTLTEETRPNEHLPVLEDDSGTYIMNARDMCLLGHIPELIDARINSFKIEGRAKSAYYTAVITNAYRTAIDAYFSSPSPDFLPEKWLLNEPLKVSHREYCTGFYFGSPSDDAQIFYRGGYVREWDIAAVVTHCENGVVFCEQRNRFFDGDTLEALMPGKKPVEIVALGLSDADGAALEAVPHPKMPFSFKCDIELPAGTILRKQRTCLE